MSVELALSRFSHNVRPCPQQIFKVRLKPQCSKKGKEGVGFGFWIIQNTRLEFFSLLREKHCLPPHEERSTCPVSCTRIEARRRNISETSSRGNVNPWHPFDRAGLQCPSCAAANNHWKEVWNWRKGNWRGRIKEGTTNLKVRKEPERELKRGNALPKCQWGHRRKGNEEDKTRGISSLG